MRIGNISQVIKRRDCNAKGITGECLAAKLRPSRLQRHLYGENLYFGFDQVLLPPVTVVDFDASWSVNRLVVTMIDATVHLQNQFQG